MRGTPNSTANSVHILVALRAVLRKINARPKHATDVGVAFIKAPLHNRIDERTAVEEHPLVRLQIVLLGDLLAAMSVPLPKLSILHLLNL